MHTHLQEHGSSDGWVQSKNSRPRNLLFMQVDALEQV